MKQKPLEFEVVDSVPGAMRKEKFRFVQCSKATLGPKSAEMGVRLGTLSLFIFQLWSVTSNMILEPALVNKNIKLGSATGSKKSELSFQFS